MADESEQTKDTTESPGRMTFDVAVCERLRAAFHDVFLHHPEVKCLAASITWNGNLNDADIMHGLWLGSDGGPVTTVDGLIGSAFQTLKMWDEQVGRAMKVVAYLKDQVQVLGPEVVDKHEIKRLQEENNQLRQEIARRQGRADHG